MLDKLKHIEVNDIKYPLAYTLNVMESIQEKYGSIGEWANILQSKNGEASIKDLKWTFTEFINEGIDIENELKGQSIPFTNTKKVGRLLTTVGIDKVVDIIVDLVSDKKEVEEDEELEEEKNE